MRTNRRCSAERRRACTASIDSPSDGKPVEREGAFDVLMPLIEARGSVLSKDELISRLWAGRVVGEDSLQAALDEVEVES
jgi:DNA-binding winged helix-turn-helix (wHTH) protein